MADLSGAGAAAPTRPPAPAPPGPPSSAPVTLRRATPEDAAPLAAFAAHAFRVTYAPPAGDSDPADVAAYVDAHFSPTLLGAELADPDVRVLLAESGGALVGYAQLRRGSRPDDAPDFAPLPVDGDPPAPSMPPHRRRRSEAAAPDAAAPAVTELSRLYVAPAHHGAGVAAALLDAARAEARAWRADRLWLAVYQRNPRAIAFYAKHGARRFATATFRMGAELQHDWLLVLPL